MYMIKLSILVITVPNRLRYFYPRLMTQLIDQTKHRNDVEVLSLFDNKTRSIGAKRQAILDLCQGEYVVFIDDDDRISDDYVEEIIKAIKNNPDCDCVVFDNLTSIDGGAPILCKYGIEFEYGYIDSSNPQKGWRGKPAHTMVYKSSIAKRHKYTDMGSGEDVDWVKRACLDIKKQVRIDKTLYFYEANYRTTSESGNLPDSVIQKNIDILLSKDK
jgi:glycosyltransferase involved in cell wall biosynthesis